MTNHSALKVNESDYAKPEVIPLSPPRLKAAKTAYNARRVNVDAAVNLLSGDTSPRAGDLVLAQVEVIGQHTRIELATGRRAVLHVGDEIVVCYGARYAPDQFEAYVPSDLSICSLVAAGGVAARFESKHSRMKKPTTIKPIGLLADRSGRPLNIEDWSLPPVTSVIRQPHTIVVLGTAMNAGKTTTAAGLVRGYKLKGRRVGAAKITGTGAGGDRWAMIDAGADRVLDFTDAGVPSTFGVDIARVEHIFVQLINHLAADDAEVIVLEVADGLFQEETAALIKSRIFKELVDDIVFAAGDAPGASAGVSRLLGLRLPVAGVSGALTASPLAIREAQRALSLPVITAEELQTGVWLPAKRAGAAISIVTAAPKHGHPASADAVRPGCEHHTLQFTGVETGA